MFLLGRDFFVVIFDHGYHPEVEADQDISFEMLRISANGGSWYRKGQERINMSTHRKKVKRC